MVERKFEEFQDTFDEIEARLKKKDKMIGRAVN